MSVKVGSVQEFLSLHASLLSSSCTLTDHHGHTFKEKEVVIEVDEKDQEFVHCPVTGESLPISSIKVIKSYSEEKSLDNRIQKAISIEVSKRVKGIITTEIENATRQIQEQNKKLVSFFLQNSEQFSAQKAQLQAEIEDLKTNAKALKEENERSQQIIDNQKQIISEKEGVIADKDKHIRYSKLSTGLLSGFGGATLSAFMMTVVYIFKKK